MITASLERCKDAKACMLLLPDTSTEVGPETMKTFDQERLVKMECDCS